jgi:hypothetical protein
VLLAQSKVKEALKVYRDALTIDERVAAADLGNALWQHDLAVGFGRVAMVEARQGARDQALRKFRNARDIIARLKGWKSGSSSGFGALSKEGKRLRRRPPDPPARVPGLRNQFEKLRKEKSARNRKTFLFSFVSPNASVRYPQVTRRVTTPERIRKPAIEQAA